MSDRVFGSCKHNKAIHYGYPCAACEAELVRSHIQDEMRAGWKPENGLHERIERLIQTAIESSIERVQRYERGRNAETKTT